MGQAAVGEGVDVEGWSLSRSLSFEDARLVRWGMGCWRFWFSFGGAMVCWMGCLLAMVEGVQDGGGRVFAH